MKDLEKRRMTRREALYMLGGGSLSLLLASCKEFERVATPSQLGVTSVATFPPTGTKDLPKTSTVTAEAKASATNRPPTSTVPQSPSATASREATASAIPEPTATKIPELLWNGDPAPLGFLKEIHGTVEKPYKDELVSGILKKIYQTDVNYLGQDSKVWMADYYLGNDAQGEKIEGKFFLGRDEDRIPKMVVRGNVFPFDPYPAGESSGHAEVIQVKELIPDLKVGHQYALILLVYPELEKFNFDYANDPRTAPIVYHEYNEAIFAKLKGEDVEIDESKFGWLYYMLFTSENLK